MGELTNKSYWMLADTELPIARNPVLQNSFEAHFKHALLFNEELMISDAQAVNCVNLRTLVNDSSSFKELLSHGLLSIATRDPSGLNLADPLTKVRDAFFREGKHHMNQSRFLLDSDLELLNDRCNIVPYTYAALRDNYTQSIFRVFEGSKAKELFGSDTQQLFLDRLRNEAQRDGGLGRVFLHKNFENDLKSINRHELWAKHFQDIIKLSDAPYVTGIPQVLATNPIYSPAHQESFQLAFPQKPQTTEKGKRIALATNLNLSSYEDALSKLHPEDILHLRDSYEFKKYQEHIKKGVSGQRQLDDAWEALKSYQELIDDYIIRRHLGLKVSKQAKGQRYIETIRKVSQESVVYALGLAITGPIGAAALSLANFFVSEGMSKVKERRDDKLGIESYKLKSQLSESESVKISAHHVATADMNETIYSSIDNL